MVVADRFMGRPLLRNSRKTVMGFSTPPDESASFFAVWRPVSTPFALL